MKNATAISHGSKRLLATASVGGGEIVSIAPDGIRFVGLGSIGLRDRAHDIRELRFR
jgi:hypothetical protein